MFPSSIVYSYRHLTDECFTVSVFYFQFKNMGGITSPYSATHPVTLSAQAFLPKPSALTASSASFADSALTSSMFASQLSQPPSITSPPIRYRQVEPPLPPRIQPQYRSTSTDSHIPPQPPPRDRRLLKCPRCETIFDLLTPYRDHIKMCLKSSN